MAYPIPSDCVEVEWIQSTSHVEDPATREFISIDLPVDAPNLGVRGDIEITSNTSGSYGTRIFGDRSNAFSLYYDYRQMSMACGASVVAKDTVQRNVIGNRQTFEANWLNSGVMKNSLGTDLQIGTAGTTELRNPTYIFTMSFGNLNGYSPWCGIRLYSLEFSHNDEVIYSFVPCRRKTDGVAGLFDTVGGVFYTNASPTNGAFAVGPDVVRFEPIMSLNNVGGAWRKVGAAQTMIKELEPVWTWVDGKYLNGASEVASSAYSYLADFLPIVGGHRVTWCWGSGGNEVHSGLVEYRNGAYYTQWSAAGSGRRTVTTYAQTNAVRFSCLTRYKDDSFVYDETDGVYLYKGKNIA